MAPPVTIEDVRRQLRMEADDETRDDDLKDWISDAADWVETYNCKLVGNHYCSVEYLNKNTIILNKVS